LPQLDLSAYRILIVDDNKTNREVLYSQLTLWGADVSQADSATSALSLLTKSLEENSDNCFDIAILDMLMPEINGAELCQKIRGNEQLDHLKLIMLTSLARPGDAQYFADLGFDFSLPKPVITSDLARALVLVSNKAPTKRSQKSLPTQSNSKKITVKPLPKSTRILLVEDNSINQIVAKSLLTNLGAQVEIANNGQEALDLLEEDYYDVVLMDCQMPIMDGYTATKVIRESQQAYKDIHIIAMTANAMSGDRDKCLDAGMNDYLTKPIDVEALENSLLKALNTPTATELVNSDNSPKEKKDSINSKSDPVLIKTENKVDICWGKDAFYKRVGQNQLLAERIVTLYCQDMPIEIDKLTKAIEAKDYKLIGEIAHKVKGSSANLEAKKLAQCALDIELAINNKKTTELESLSMTLREDFAKLIMNLEEFLAIDIQNE